MYFIVAGVAGYYTSKIRAQKVLLDRREKRTVALYMLVKDLTSAVNLDEVVDSAVSHLGDVFDAKVAAVLVDEAHKLNPKTHLASTFVLNDSDWLVANWTFNNAKKAGENTNTLPFAKGTYYPIRSKSGIYGVFGLSMEKKEEKSLEIDMLLDTFLAQISVAIEREYLNNIAKNNLIHLETERLYSTLFDSISHELKTPITTIKSTVETFTDPNNLQNEQMRTSLVKEMEIAVFRLTKLVDNLLDMTRVESKQMHLKLAPHFVLDLINSVLDKIEIETHGRAIQYEHGDEDLTINCDFALLEQAILNIVRNAIEYTPADSQIVIRTGRIDGGTFISIADNGPGVPADSLEKLFDKFHREPGTKTGGMGLGLSIAKGFIEAHGGKITAVNRDSGGLEFLIYLP
jgi:two-component system sensor histidine kinase KdpD